MLHNRTKPSNRENVRRYYIVSKNICAAVPQIFTTNCRLTPCLVGWNHVHRVIARLRKSQNWNLISKRVGQPNLPRNWEETEKANIPFLSSVSPFASEPTNYPQHVFIEETPRTRKRFSVFTVRGGVDPMTPSLLQARYVQPYSRDRIKEGRKRKREREKREQKNSGQREGSARRDKRKEKKRKGKGKRYLGR